MDVKVNVIIPKSECMVDVLLTYYHKLPQELKSDANMDLLLKAGEYLEKHYGLCTSRRQANG